MNPPYIVVKKWDGKVVITINYDGYSMSHTLSIEKALSFIQDINKIIEEIDADNADELGF